jgi:hypothetical protein
MIRDALTLPPADCTFAAVGLSVKLTGMQDG